MTDWIRQSQTHPHSVPHDSAQQHASGAAIYIDDMPHPQNLLHVVIGQSPHAHAKLIHIHTDKAMALPGVKAVLSAKDVPGINDVGAVMPGDPIFAVDRVLYAGQSVFAVVATSERIARQAMTLVQVDYEPLPAILDIQDARQHDSYVLPSKVIARGNAQQAIAQSPIQVCGDITIGGQDHFYLETQVALSIPQEDHDYLIYSSTQHPAEVQHACAQVLGLSDHKVQVFVRRMGGAFGGKESQPALYAAIAALSSQHTGQACKLRLNRDEDMCMTGKRHDYHMDYRVGCDEQGTIQGIEFIVASRCGMSADLSGSINDRTMFHLDNAYYLPHVRIESHRCRTHTVSNTAFRGFGGPQGMVAMERVIDAIAYRLKRDPLQIRERNYYGSTPRNRTPYGMKVTDNLLPELTNELKQLCDYEQRRQTIHVFNQNTQRTSPWIKKGLALTPVKLGISFTATFLNQAGALIHIYRDGSIYLNHGGTEMGQGLFTKVAQIVAHVFQVPIHKIKLSATATDKVPNTSPTAASSGCDLNGQAAKVAAETLKQRLTDFLCDLHACSADSVTFTAEGIRVNHQILSFDDVVSQAYFSRISLSATGFYRTPDIHYDEEQDQNQPFFYFAYGVSAAEVAVDTLTGEHTVERVDILHDCGDSINPAIDHGQVEGGFIQGMGWLTMEELVFNTQGHLVTHGPSTYKIPTAADRPKTLTIHLRCQPNPADTIFRSKAVGEPPLMLAISVFNAIHHAIASLANNTLCPPLSAPATPEAILRACMAVQAGGKCD